MHESFEDLSMFKNKLSQTRNNLDVIVAIFWTFETQVIEVCEGFGDNEPFPWHVEDKRLNLSILKVVWSSVQSRELQG